VKVLGRNPRPGRTLRSYPVTGLNAVPCSRSETQNARMNIPRCLPICILNAHSMEALKCLIIIGALKPALSTLNLESARTHVFQSVMTLDLRCMRRAPWRLPLVLVDHYPSHYLKLLSGIALRTALVAFRPFVHRKSGPTSPTEQNMPLPRFPLFDPHLA
jgi:hypothetical protein